jgi:hypothetical protein
MSVRYGTTSVSALDQNHGMAFTVFRNDRTPTPAWSNAPDCRRRDGAGLLDPASTEMQAVVIDSHRRDRAVSRRRRYGDAGGRGREPDRVIVDAPSQRACWCWPTRSHRQVRRGRDAGRLWRRITVRGVVLEPALVASSSAIAPGFALGVAVALGAWALVLAGLVLARR